MLLRKGPFWSACTDNIVATSATLPGTSVGSGASNADGTTVQLLPALSHDVCYLVVGIGGMGVTTAEDNSCLLDILYDPAGGTSWGSFIDDLICGFNSTPIAGRDSISAWYHFPIWIPSGASIAARCRKNGATASTGNVVIYAYGEPANPSMWWCGQKVESLGINAASSKGTTVTPGSSGSFGTYATIGTSTYRYGAIQAGIGGSDSSAAAKGYAWRIGVASARMAGTPQFYTSIATSEVIQRCGMSMPIFVNVPASTALQIAGACNTTSPENCDCALYGVY